MLPTKKTGRIAGLLYLLLVITGIIGMRFLPQKFIDWNNASQTAANISTQLGLFRFYFVLQTFTSIIWLFLVIALYILVKPVNKKIAQVMVIFVLAGISVYFAGLIYQWAIIQITSGKEYLSTFSADQQQSLVMFFLDLFYGGDLIATVFYGLWLLPLGYLMYKSTYLSRVLGVILMIGCFSYLGEFIGRALFENYYSSFYPKYMLLPADIGEIGTCLWLLIIGIRTKPALS